MPIVLVIALLASIVWGVAYARRGSLLVGCFGLLAINYVLGHWFWHANVGPLPLTLDRIALIGLFAAFVAKWRWNLLDSKPMAGSDWLVIVLIGVLSISTIMGSRGAIPEESTSPLWRLIFSFLIPATIYWIARQSVIEQRQWQWFLAGMTALGIYLAVTALAEVAGMWSIVFPRYIADPLLGTHFGRARGPILNSASLGLCITVCFWCCWALLEQLGRVWKLVLLAALGLMALAVLVTFTRSTWLGLGGSAMVMMWLRLPRDWRLPVLGGSAIAGLLVLVVAWGSIVGIKREGTASDSKHSVQQRAAFTYVSWKMFQDHPIFGVGFGRFYDKKLPYLTDRTQSFELESIRGLQHHNTFLSLLTDAGMVGLAALLAVFVAWGRCAWKMAHSKVQPAWVTAHGALMLTLLTAYFPTALFHDITLLPTELWALFCMAGITVGLACKSQTSQLAFPTLEAAIHNPGEPEALAPGVCIATRNYSSR